MNNRFKIEKSVQPDKWVCTDTLNNIVCVFEQGKFNDTQEFTMLEDFNASNYMKIAEIAREMADWLRENHYDKIFYNEHKK